MAISDRLVGNWKATTDGEKLFHFLVKNVGEFRALEHLYNDSISDIIRGRDFMRFSEGAIVLHCFGRLLQAAKWYRKEYIDCPQQSNRAIEAFAIETLGISKATCSSFSKLAQLALEAANAASDSSKTPNGREKSKVIKNCKKIFNCYSCGIDLHPDDKADMITDNATGKLIPNPHYLEYEHLWPHTYGGNSIEENLLPSCPYCNRAKSSMASWEWVPLQSIFPKFEGRSEFICEENHPSELKIGLHMRVAISYARKNGTTLKNAYLSVGPRLDRIYLVDTFDTADFFNLRVNDFQESGIYLEDL